MSDGFEGMGGILNFDDDMLENVKINPDAYVHFALIGMQRALMFSSLKGSIDDGLVAYSVFVEYIEIIGKAKGIIPSDYDDRIKEFMDSEEIKGLSLNVKNMKIANKKLLLLLSEYFDRKGASGVINI